MILCLRDQLAVLNKYPLASRKQLDKPPNRFGSQQATLICLQQ